MKKELLQNVKVLPYKSGDAIDRAGFLSAVIAVAAKADGDVKIVVTHSDTADGTFEAVSDEKLFVGGNGEAAGLTAADVTNFDVDLAGCKPFIKVLCWAIRTPGRCKEVGAMPRIYKPVGPKSNKAAAPVTETKTPKPPKADEPKKEDGGK